MTDSMYRIKSPLHNIGKYERKAWEWAVVLMVDFDELKELLKEERDIHYIAEEMNLHPEIVARAVEMKRDEWSSEK